SLDNCGNLYIAEVGNARIRKVTYPPVITTPTISLSSPASVPVGSPVAVTAAVRSAGSSYIIHWMNHGIEFTTTTVPSVTYTKPPGIDNITARVVPTGWGCWDSTTSAVQVVDVDVLFNVSRMLSGCKYANVQVYPNPVGR